MKGNFPGRGKNKPQRLKKIDKLLLDPNNPRLAEKYRNAGQIELLRVLYKEFDLIGLATSMANNGYFDEEPVVAYPSYPKDFLKKFKDTDPDSLEKNPDYISFIENPDTSLIVVEGNRRLAAAKILTDPELGEKVGIKEKWPALTEEIKQDLMEIPVIVYPNREQIIPYMGVRHILGVEKWGSFARARYIADLKKNGYSLVQVSQLFGVAIDNIIETYVAYRLVQIIEEEGLPVEEAQSKFSYVRVALRQSQIKRYLGITTRWQELDAESPVSEARIENLKNLFSFLFGDGSKEKVIADSRGIHDKLAPVLGDPEAADYLNETRDLYGAFERSGGEEKYVRRLVTKLNRLLETILGVIHKHKTEEIKQDLKECEETFGRIMKEVEG
jgi:hypothetical protein